MNHLPILGISMGDPFGNGPEVTVKALRKGAEGYAEIEFNVEIGELE